jgi:hypothetical protein
MSENGKGTCKRRVIMLQKSIMTIFVSLALVLVCVGQTYATDPGALAKESEEYCKSTAQSRPTPPDAIIAKVNEACRLLQEEGTAAFPKFKGDGSKFLFEGTYIWIHKLDDATILMHPIKYKMEGKKYAGLKDKKGKRFFALMNKLARENGSGWVEYYWPKPGSKEIVRKVSYVQKCKTADGIEVVLGCGIYHASQTDLAKLDIR